MAAHLTLRNSGPLTEKNISLVQDHILDEILGHQDVTAKNATSKLLGSYKEWVNAMHPYRHGQDVESYDNPHHDLTILALSNGASYLRWFASLIQLKLENKNKKNFSYLLTKTAN